MPQPSCRFSIACALPPPCSYCGGFAPLPFEPVPAPFDVPVDEPEEPVLPMLPVPPAPDPEPMLPEEPEPMEPPELPLGLATLGEPAAPEPLPPIDPLPLPEPIEPLDPLMPAPPLELGFELPVPMPPLPVPMLPLAPPALPAPAPPAPPAPPAACAIAAPVVPSTRHAASAVFLRVCVIALLLAFILGGHRGLFGPRVAVGDEREPAGRFSRPPGAPVELNGIHGGSMSRCP